MTIHLQNCNEEFTFTEGDRINWWEKMTSGGLEIVGPLAIDVPFATYSPSTSEGEIPRQLNNCLHHFILFHKKMHEVERFVFWKIPSLISLSHLSKFAFIQISGCRDSYNLSKGQFDNIDYKTLKVDIPFVAPRAAPNDACHLVFVPLCSPLSSPNESWQGDCI